MDDKNDLTNSDGSNRRWWEFYFVRYAMGMVVGAIAIYFMVISDPILKHAFFIGAETVSNLTQHNNEIAMTARDFNVLTSFPALTAFAALGLSFCYIASGPILVMHVGRYFCIKDLRTKCSILVFLMTMAVAFLVIFVSVILIRERLNGNGIRGGYVAGDMIFALLVSVQVGLLFFIGLNKDNFFKFYSTLSTKRKEARCQNLDIVESYRHMREHGNSFLIVFLEIMLAIIMVSIGPSWVKSPAAGIEILPYVVILMIWIVPAMIVWFVAISLELRFSGYNNRTKNND